MWAVVPLKQPDRAKSRLAPVLDAIQRRTLLFAMARHVIRTLQSTEGIDRVAVVTSSLEVAEFTRGLDAQVLMQSDDFGSASAFTFALQQLKPLQHDRLLMITGDLPLLTVSALSEVIAQGGERRSVVLAPDQRGRCVNALLCAPPDVITPGFGSDSVRNNLAATAAAGLELRFVEHPALQLDLDTPDDLDQLRQRDDAGAASVLGALSCAVPA
jgi:2-phospho-L-lactate guanylyltransferase